MRADLKLALCALCLYSAGAVAGPATVPAGFQDELVIGNYNGLSQFAWAPDGLLFVASKGGNISVWDGATLTSVLQLPTDNFFERGINGLTVDPDYLTNGHVWVYYANSATTRNWVSRLTWDGSDLGNEENIFQGPVMLNGDHSAGCIRFASDKTLYIAMGDDRQNAVTAQDPFNLPGSIIRINRDGSAPADNPFADGVNGEPRVWAYGLRNPYRISIQPDTDNVFIADVGETRWEEISIGLAGGNFGWPSVEGPEPAGVPGFIYPIYTEFHDTGSAIIGGDFAKSGDYSPEYEGDYFFGNYVTGKLHRMQLDGSNNPIQVDVFAEGMVFPSDIQFGPDGALYYASRALTGQSTGEVRRIVYVGGANRDPVAIGIASPDSGPAPLMTNLDGTGSSDPDEDSLTHSWDLGDGTFADTAVVAKAYPLGVYDVVLTVDDGQGGTGSSSPIRIVSGNNRPDVTIGQPIEGSTYTAGQIVSYDAVVTDIEDSSIPCSAYTWKATFHHNIHTHPFLGPITGICSGSFTTDNTGEPAADTWYEIQLNVTDSGNPLGASGALTGSQIVEIFPDVTTMTFATSPRPDLMVTLDGQPLNTPADVQGVVNFIRSIETVAEQVMPDGHTYRWSNWSDGGAIAHNIATPALDTTFFANFTCDAIEPVSGLLVDLLGLQNDLLLTWNSVDPLCLARYRIYRADGVVPSSVPGQFPNDPEWTLVGTTSNDAFLSTGGDLSYFLVVAEGTDGAEGPSMHYGSFLCPDGDGDGLGNGSLGNAGCVVADIDSNDNDPFVCADLDLDGCEDCTSGTFDIATDGMDDDADGICDLSDGCSDADADGLGNGTLSNVDCVDPTTDSDDSDSTSCADTDLDGCDDCTNGVFSPQTDGVDSDGDGTCDAADTCSDVDGDGVGTGGLGNVGCITLLVDANDGDPNVCGDTDGDGCEDCLLGTFDPAADGLDTEGDGICDAGDNCPFVFNSGQADDDNDGSGNGCDTCTDGDGDGIGAGPNGHSGCLAPNVDADDSDPTVCADTDADTCDDCSSGIFDPANDGQDTDGDGLCDAGDPTP